MCYDNHKFSLFPLVNNTIENCCIGCDKPGPGSMDHDPSQNSCTDWALCCSPCAFVIDVLSFPCRFYNYYCTCCKKTNE